jgi:hypothetical protein
MTPPPAIPPLPPGATLAIWPLAACAEVSEAGPHGGHGAPLYRSDGRWLHPLFDLLELLGDARAAPRLTSAGELFLRDRVIGRAAAFLILRAGIRHAWADLVSDGAVAIFSAGGGDLGWGERISAIDCLTESQLREVDDPAIAWTLLLARRVAGRPR